MNYLTDPREAAVGAAYALAEATMRIRARFADFAVGVCALYAVGCNGAPTTVLLDVDSDSSASIQALYGQVAVASRPAGTEQLLSGPVQLPGTLTVWLPDVGEPATIYLRAVTSDGRTLTASVDVVAVPHHQIQQSVTLSAAGGGPPIMNGNSDLAGATPVDMAQPAAPPPADMAPVVIAKDDFHRAADQAFWGTASDGNIWGADANTNGAFSIVSNTGVVTDSVVENVSAVLGPSVSDADVVITGSVGSFVTTGSNNEIGPMVRWVDNNNFYKAGFNGQNLRLYVRTNAGPVTLSTVPFAASGGVAYSIRIRVVGTSFMAKAWQAGTSEPAAWMVTATDASIAAGKCGIRFVFNATTTMKLTSFVATAP